MQTTWGGPQMNCGGVCREWGCTIGVTPPVCVCEAGGDRTLPCGTEPRDMGRATPIPTGVQPCPYWGAEGFSCAPPPPHFLARAPLAHTRAVGARPRVRPAVNNRKSRLARGYAQLPAPARRPGRAGMGKGGVPFGTATDSG